MKYFLLCACFLFALNARAQSSEASNAKPDQMPVAGYDYNKYLRDNLHYPEKAVKHNREGRVIVKFVVNEDGSISDCEVIKGINRACDAEAIRVVQNMPPWKPGMKDGKPVRVYFKLPIAFKLTD